MQQGPENKENYQQQKRLLIVTQILLVSTLKNVWETVWRIPLLLLRCEGLIFSHSSMLLQFQIKR